MTATPLRVLLAEDHTLVRKGIRAVLRQVGWIDVIAEAADGREALDLARRHGPDVVVMDIAMPGLNGLEATARITKESPRTRVLILSMHATEEYVAQALRAGAARASGRSCSSWPRASPARRSLSGSTSPSRPSRRTAARSCTGSTSTT